MNFNKLILILTVSFCTIYAQNLTISGTVTDTSGAVPVSGAVVALEKHGYTATTNSEGRFTLTGAVSISSKIHKWNSTALSANMSDGILSVYVPKLSMVTITTYTLQGKAVSSTVKELNAGTHRITQPALSHGVYIYRIDARGQQLAFKGSYLEQSSKTLNAATPVKTATTCMNRNALIDDVIIVSKKGLLNYRLMVTNSDTSNITIKMIPSAGNITDADGNVYESVRIGDQVWTVENWRSTKYADGTNIPHVMDSAAWGALTTPAYCWYSNKTDHKFRVNYGALYNWHVVSSENPKNIAPDGWRVPTDEDWTILENYLISNRYNWDNTRTSNKIAKAMASSASEWNSYSVTGGAGNRQATNNRTGFSALPGGYRYVSGDSNNLGTQGLWWSSTEINSTFAHYRELSYQSQNLFRNDSNSSYLSKSSGFSLRLISE